MEIDGKVYCTTKQARSRAKELERLATLKAKKSGRLFKAARALDKVADLAFGPEVAETRAYLIETGRDLNDDACRASDQARAIRRSLAEMARMDAMKKAAKAEQDLDRIERIEAAIKRGEGVAA